MNKYFHGLLTGISVLPALLIMPAMADVIQPDDGAEITGVLTDKYSVGGGKTVVFNGVTVEDFDTNASYGGVIENYGDLDVTVSNSMFAGNSSVLTGGVIDNDGGNSGVAALSITGDTSFIGNNSGRGGALANWATGIVTINGNTLFDGNSVSASVLSGLSEGNGYYLQRSNIGLGGAVFNVGDMSINGATFTGNSTSEKLLLLAYSDAAGQNALPSKNTYVGGDGGAIYNSGDLTISNGNFAENHAGEWGGAISNGGTLNITNTIFDNNSAKFAGAILDYLDSEGGINNISNSIIKNNTADEIGGVGLYTKYATSNFNNVEFNSNHALSSAVDSDGSGAIFVGAEASANIQNSIFDSNSSNAVAGAIGTRSFNLGSNNAAKLDIAGSIFTNNVAATKGGAINNYLYNDANDDGYVSITNSLFTSNSAANGGAIYNNTGHLGDKLINPRSVDAQDVQDIDTPLSRIQVGNIYFGDTSFTNNIASADGGAIYNEGVVTIAANNKDVMFSGNKANVVTDGQGAITSFTANDIYNVGTLNLNAASGKMIALSGGVDGSGVMNVSGAGKVDVANTLKGQNVTVAANAGEFHLNGVDLTGSTVSVASGATLNLMDNNINNYSGITLAGGSNLKTDIDLSNGGKDGFVATGAFNLTQLGIVGDSAAGAVTQFTLSDQVVNVADNLKVFTTNLAYAVEDGESAGKIKVTAGAAASGGLAAAAGSTTEMTRENIVYSVTADDATVAASAVEVKNADMLIAGQGTGALDETVTLTKNLTVGDTSTLSIENAKFAGTGTIENANGGFLTILNSHIATDINNAGYMYSDPSLYSGITNNIGVIDYAEADTFDTTAVLNNSGVVNVLNGVTFNSGATVTGNGVINLAGGTTHFNNTASANTVKLASGADFDGTLASTGILDTRNGNIDTITGGVSGGDLYLDANLVAGTRDNFGDGTTGATIKGIKLANAGYGTADSVTLDMGGATLDSDVDIQGVNYYTEVTQSGDNVTFANKLINESNLYNKLGANWTGGNYIKNAANYTNGADATHLTVGDALSALDDQVKLNADNIATNATNITANTNMIGDVNYSDESGTSVLAGGSTTTVRGALDALDAAIAGKQGTLGTGDIITTLIADGAVTTDKIGASAVTTAKIENNAVTYDKLASGVQTELDKIANIGDVNYSDESGTSVLASGNTTTVRGALDALDGAIATNAANITANANTIGDVDYSDESGTSVLAGGSTNTVRGALDALDAAIAGKQGTLGTGDITTTLIADGAVTTDKIGASAVTTAKIADGAVTADKIGASAVTTAKIENNAVTYDKLASGVQTELDKIANIGDVNYSDESGTSVLANGDTTTVRGALDALDTAIAGKQATLGAEDITTALIADGAVTADKIGASAVTTAKIENNAVTYDKLASGVQAKLDSVGDVDYSDESGTSVLANGDTTTVRGALNALDGAINTLLNGNAQTANSVEYKIAQVVNDNNGVVATTINNATKMEGDSNSETNVYKNFGNGVTVTQAVASLDTNIGKVHELITHETTDENSPLVFNGTNATASKNKDTNGKYVGNLAVGTTIEDHLVALDNTLGTMSTLSGTHVDNTKSVAGNLEQLSLAIDNVTSNSVAQANAYTDAQLMVARDTSIAQANAYTDKQIESLDKNLSAGVAGAVALSSVEVSNVERGEVSVGAGYGYFNGQSAAAFGAAMGLSNRWSVNAGAGVSSADVTFRAGTNYKFKLF